MNRWTCRGASREIRPSWQAVAVHPAPIPVPWSNPPQEASSAQVLRKEPQAIHQVPLPVGPFMSARKLLVDMLDSFLL